MKRAKTRMHNALLRPFWTYLSKYGETAKTHVRGPWLPEYSVVDSRITTNPKTASTLLSHPCCEFYGPFFKKTSAEALARILRNLNRVSK